VFLAAARIGNGLMTIDDGSSWVVWKVKVRNLSPQFRRRIRDHIELTKPRVTWLILISTAVGYFFGLPRAHNWLQVFKGIHFFPLIHTIVGTGLIASGAAALNQWYERDTDLRMKRTSRRPLPSGRLSASTALAFGASLSAAGFLQLCLGVNLLSGLIGAFTLASYLFLYTPMKRRTWWSTTIGAIPGAMPPVIGYAAATGTLTRESWALFAILFLWQFPHFYAIGWMYRDDYARAGIRMLPVIEPDGRSTMRQIVMFGAALIPVSLGPWMLGMSGHIYLGGALLLGVWFLYSGVRVAMERSLARARSVLITSVLYLPFLCGLMILDRPAP
jgi:heme o synthase